MVLQIKWLVLIPTVRKRQTQTETQLPDLQPTVPSLEIKTLISSFPFSNCPIFLLFTVTIPTLYLTIYTKFSHCLLSPEALQVDPMPTKRLKVLVERAQRDQHHRIRCH